MRKLRKKAQVKETRRLQLRRQQRRREIRRLIVEYLGLILMYRDALETPLMNFGTQLWGEHAMNYCKTYAPEYVRRLAIMGYHTPIDSIEEYLLSIDPSIRRDRDEFARKIQAEI